MNAEDTTKDQIELGSTSNALTILQKAQEKRQKRESHLFLDVPSWDGDLIAEYRILDPDEMKASADRAMLISRNGGSKPGDNDIQMIISMHVGLHVLDRATGKREAITDEYGHVGFDRIAIYLGKEHLIESQADAVKYLMSERDEKDPDKFVVNIVAITLHANAIQNWMRDTSKRKVDLGALLGEL